MFTVILALMRRVYLQTNAASLGKAENGYYRSAEKLRERRHVEALRHPGDPFASRAREGVDAGAAGADRPRQGQRAVLRRLAEGRRCRVGDLACRARQAAGAAQVDAGRGAEEES